MKTVVNRAQVAHLWAAQTQAHARNGSRNFFFSGPVIYSYGRHYPAGIFTPFHDSDGARIVLINGANYSSTTRRHVGEIYGALRGHPLRVVDVPGGRSAFSDSEAIALSRGNADALRAVVEAIADDARATIRRAMRRRVDSYALRELETARDAFDTCAMLANCGRTKRERAKLSRAIGTRPAIPDGLAETVVYEYGTYTRPAPGFRERVAELRVSMAADDARAVFNGRDARMVRDQWRAARNSRLSPRVRVAACDTAARHAAKIHAAAKRGRVDLPRDIPTRAAIRDLRAQLLPRAGLQWARDNAESVRRARRELVRDFYRGQRIRHDSVMRRAYGVPFRDARDKLAMRVEPEYVETVRCLDCLAQYGAFPRDATFAAWHRDGELLRACAAVAVSESNRHARDARNALRALRAAIAEFDTDAEWIRAKLARIDARDSLESEHAAAVRAINDARDSLESEHAAAVRAINDARAVIRGEPGADRRGYSGRGYAAACIDTAVTRARRYFETFENTRAELCGGMPSGFDTADIETARDRAAFLESRAIAEKLARETREKLAAATLAHDSHGRTFTARDLASDAKSRARDYATAATTAARLAAEIGETYAAPEPAEALAAECARLADRIGDAILSGSRIRGSERFAADCWRLGDSAARAAFLYHAEPRFRLTDDGREIESSLGARVSVDAGRVLWRMIRRAVQSGRAVEFEYGKGPHIGPFQLRSISTDGAAVVGCHSITASEAREFAAFMNWPAIDDAAEDSDAA